MSWQALVIAIGVIIMSISGTEGQTENMDQAVFYVATDGNDSWSGELDAPFATLSRAMEAVRDLKNEQDGLLKQPVMVYLRGGTYFLDEPLILTPDDSGTEDCPVTIAAYQNEKPVISGGKTLTNWKPYKDKILQHPQNITQRDSLVVF